jgi:DNA replication ATP-dependent helicase Dna2
MKFYDGTLNIARENQKDSLLPSWNKGKDHSLSQSILDQLNKFRLVFIDVPTEGSLVNWNKSNPKEAKLVASLVMNKALSLDDKFTALTSIGVIAPFRNQVALIEQEIESQLSDLDQPELISKIKGITIDTVEKFQGSQRDTIILSLTVMQPRQINGIVNMDITNTVDRKLNVALSRAQSQLIIIGNADVLVSNTIYKELMEHIKLNGAWINLA